METRIVPFNGFTQAPKAFFEYSALLKKYGLDVVRFAACGQPLGTTPFIEVQGPSRDIDEFEIDVLELHVENYRRLHQS